MGGHASAPKKRPWWDGFAGTFLLVGACTILVIVIVRAESRVPKPGTSYTQRVASAPEGTLWEGEVDGAPEINVRTRLIALPHSSPWPQMWIPVPRGYRAMNCEVGEDLATCLSTETDVSKVPYEYRCKLSDGSVPDVWTEEACRLHDYYQVRSRTEKPVHVAHWLVPCEQNGDNECPEPEP